MYPLIDQHFPSEESLGASSYAELLRCCARACAGCTGNGEDLWKVLKVEEPTTANAHWILERASRRLEALAHERGAGAAAASPARARIKEEVI